MGTFHTDHFDAISNYSVEEMLNAIQNINPEVVFIEARKLKEAGLLPDEPYDIFFKGFYPPLHDVDKHFHLDDWFENYIDTYLDLDIKDHAY